MAQSSPADETLNHLHRLSQKPGVQATLILSRSTGAIVRSSGLISREDSIIEPETAKIPMRGTDINGTTNPESKASGPEQSRPGSRSALQNLPQPPPLITSVAAVQDSGNRGALIAEDIAKRVFKFFADATEFAEGMEAGRELDKDGDENRTKVQDGVRLLRLRLRRKEIVIVPDSKFLLVVIHDTPPA